MTNPFGLPGAFPWRRKEATNLHNALARDVRSPQRVELLAQAAGLPLTWLVTNQAPGLLWKDVLELAAREGAVLALVEHLLEQDDLPGVAGPARAVLQARSAVDRVVDDDNRLIADRQPLRHQVKLLRLDQEPVKVLVVRGDPESGKTWSRFLFERAAREVGAEVTYLYNGTAASVHWVVDKLFSALQASDRIPPVDTSEVAWYGQVCNRLAEAAARRGTPLWIAVDDLGPGRDGRTPLLDPEIRAFFDEFVPHLVDPAVSRWFRLLLIHYPDGAMPTKWQREVWWEDRTAPGDIGRAELVEAVRDWAAVHGRNLLEQDVDRLVAGVLATVDAPQSSAVRCTPRLRRLQDEMTAALRRLAG